jgi:hypothetical protein
MQNRLSSPKSKRRILICIRPREVSWLLVTVCLRQWMFNVKHSSNQRNLLYRHLFTALEISQSSFKLRGKAWCLQNLHPVSALILSHPNLLHLLKTRKDPLSHQWLDTSAVIIMLIIIRGLIYLKLPSLALPLFLPMTKGYCRAKWRGTQCLITFHP